MERGSRIAGRYVLDKRLGAGRGGQVWAARDDRSGGHVALKLRHERAPHLDIELAGLRTFEHPHLLRILDAGTDSGSVFVVTELATYGSLEAVTKPLAPDNIEALAIQMLDALAYLHAHGVLHADIKTENIFVASLDPPVFKLGDFGLAHRRSVGSGPRGSPAFMPPEVIRGEPTDERSDLYALGVTLYEATFGSLPFDDPDTRRILARHLTETPSGLLEPGDASSRLVALLRRLLPKEPAERPTDARAALAEWRGEESGLPSWAPPHLGVLLGRDAEIDILNQMLAAGAGAVAVDGPPGIGKTRLLREFALRAELNGAHVDWWSPATGDQHAQDPEASAASSVFIVDDLDALSAPAREAVATRTREILLTNGSHRLVCIAGRGTATRFLADALAAGSLPEPTELQLQVWLDADVRRASAALLGARSVHDELVRLVASASGGVPAGVEGACRALVEQRLLVRGEGDVLTVPATASSHELTRHMRDQLQGSIATLSTNEFQLLGILALLRSPAPLERLLVMHKTAAGDLTALQRLGLAVSAPSTRTPGFTIAHASARAAALTYLSSQARRAVHDRLADAFDLVGDGLAADVHRAQGTDLDRARHALERFASTEDALFSSDVVASLSEGLLELWPYDQQPRERHLTQLRYLDTLHRIGDYDRALVAAEQMRLRAGTPEETQNFSNRIARVYVARGEGAAAIAALGTPPQGPSASEADLIRAAAMAKQLRYVESLDSCERLAESITHDNPLHDELMDLRTSTLTILGRFGEAESLLKAAIERSETRETQRSLATFLSRLGNTYFYEGRMSEAETPLRRSYDIYERLGDRTQQVRLLNSLAAVSAETGQLWRAHDLLRVALDLSRRLGEALTTFFMIGNLVELLASLGHFCESLELANSAIASVGDRSIPQSILPTLISRAKLFAAIGAEDNCHADVSRAVAVELEPLHRAQLSMILCEVALLRGDLDTAAIELAKSREVVAQIGAHDEVVRAGLLEARLQLERGDPTGALEIAHTTTSRAKDLRLVAAAVEADVLLAEIALEIEPNSAGVLAQATLDTAVTLGMRESVWRARRIAARASGIVGDVAACVAGYDECLSLLRQQCDSLPVDLANAYLDHPDRARVLVELAAIRERLGPD